MEAKTTKKPPGSRLFSDLIVASGSGFANFASNTLCYPLDTINTWVKGSSLSRRIPHVIKDHLKSEGIQILYRGIGTQFTGVFIPSFIYFLSYEISNRLAKGFLDKRGWQAYSLYIPTFTATLSEVVALLVYVPVDTIKTRMQMNLPTQRYGSLRSGLMEVVRREGLIRLYTASPMYFLSAILLNTVLFQTYELQRISQMQRQNKSNGDLGVLDSVYHTLIASVVATLVTNPLDLIITRYQLIDGQSPALSMRKVTSDVIRKDGLIGLNRGLGIKTLYCATDACIYLPIYEVLRKSYGQDFAANLE